MQTDKLAVRGTEANIQWKPTQDDYISLTDIANIKGRCKSIMKMAVIYHSVTGNTKNMGEHIVKGMNSVESVDAKSFPIEAVDLEFVKEAKCVVFGSPIYAAHITGQMMNYLLAEAGKLELAGKLAGAYTTAQYVHGGAELGIREMLDHCMVMGALMNDPTLSEQMVVSCLDWVGLFFACNPCVSRAAGFFNLGHHMSPASGKQFKIRVQNV